ncbi:hypothetical protein ACMYUM_29560 (plasmid) [Priestia megaterium]|uniref:hypothetical protein n=1 Tax=Priestia TaxID=2800373 RepID=UPI0010CD305E|nr:MULTISPECIES: hypothetical protein [Priestia]MBU3574047.1 hypothetical protein [Priestia aryabhattai]MDH3155846.1 hypothetical protein [Priestia megaterium]MED4117231.1 hypothetical protein [Priestia megaterium]QCR30361.1 hypothetical protein C1N54_26315 [Priestia megaterium]
MTKLFAINAGMSFFAVAKAENVKEVLTILVNRELEEQEDFGIRAHIDDFSIEGLYGEFFRDEKGLFIESHILDYPHHIRKMSPKERDTYIQSHVEKNAKAFWRDHPFYAELYLREFKKYKVVGKEVGNTFSPHFSDEFYFITAKLIITETDWYGEDFHIIEIDLADRNYQLIFELTLEE